LPLDDCLYALQRSIPHLTRSALHRCPQRHGLSRLSVVEGDKPGRQTFKRYPIGFLRFADLWFTSTSVKYRPPRESSFSSLVSTGRPSSQSPNSLQQRTLAKLSDADADVVKAQTATFRRGG
jgi:hypothetical protein